MGLMMASAKAFFKLAQFQKSLTQHISYCSKSILAFLPSVFFAYQANFQLLKGIKFLLALWLDALNHNPLTALPKLFLFKLLAPIIGIFSFLKPDFIRHFSSGTEDLYLCINSVCAVATLPFCFFLYTNINKTKKNDFGKLLSKIVIMADQRLDYQELESFFTFIKWVKAQNNKPNFESMDIQYFIQLAISKNDEHLYSAIAKLLRENTPKALVEIERNVAMTGKYRLHNHQSLVWLASKAVNKLDLPEQDLFNQINHAPNLVETIKRSRIFV